MGGASGLDPLRRELRFERIGSGKEGQGRFVKALYLPKPLTAVLSDAGKGIGSRQALDGCARHAGSAPDFVDTFIGAGCACADDDRAMDVGKAAHLPETEADREEVVPASDYRALEA